MSAVAEILWEAAADVERRGVRGEPNGNQTCAVMAIRTAAGVNPMLTINQMPVAPRRACKALGFAVGVKWKFLAPSYNDRQPSRAVVAAAMRDAAYLAEWAGDHLLGGSK